jgi:predicted nucleic acid-binding protein
MAKRIVIDTGVIVKLLNQNHELNIGQADLVLKDAYDGKITLFTPEIAKYEVGKVLLLGKKLSQLESKTPIALLFELPIQFVSLTNDLLRESFAIAHAFKLSYSESIFIALSEAKKAVYLTEKTKKEYKDAGIETVELKDY